MCIVLGFRPQSGYCYHCLGQRFGFVPALPYGKNKLLCPDLPLDTSSVSSSPTSVKDLTLYSPVSSLEEGRVWESREEYWDKWFLLVFGSRSSPFLFFIHYMSGKRFNETSLSGFFCFWVFLNQFYQRVPVATVDWCWGKPKGNFQSLGLLQAVATIHVRTSTYIFGLGSVQAAFVGVLWILHNLNKLGHRSRL